ncbi:ferredoxin-NADP reductase [Tahibacter aquaticus]|uniref:Ferredoxin-NADP reductase n=2 Tax=Tahibacter aquaticus TaxID=520092 RepID=A0A4R6YM00_9GAMM|nr:ferredoxin-NADP reductase [Tahibacter aquaticus]
MMDDMMRQMGAPPRKELYPSLMEVEAFTPDKRQQFERLARERMKSGTALMSSGLEKLSAPSSEQDLPAMREATALMRQGVVQFDTGISSLQAISEGKPPRAVALDWFKQNMSLLPSADMQRPHGIFGLSGFHYFTMFLLLAFAATMIWINLKKMQRAQALAARLTPQPGAVLPERTLTPAAQSIPPSLLPEDAPSKSNAWTGLLRVVQIFEESPNVVTLRLTDPSGGSLPFRHLPGQFVTFTVKPNDQMVKRSYTIASSPTRRDYVEVTVKREEHGTVSGFLHSVRVGDTLQTTGPSGNFTFVGDGANSIVLISGGVGITPMMSVVRYLTDRSWPSDIFFIFGCRGEKDVIYREELEYLQRRHPNLHLAITAIDVASADWPYARGNITKELLSQAVPHIEIRRVHLCGPKPMMDALKPVLIELGVPLEQIKTEIFIGKERPATPPTLAEGVTGSEQSQPTTTPVEGAETAGVAVATFARSKRTALFPPSKTLLEVSEDVGVNIDYSCRVGTCGVCKVKLLSGSVTMEVQDSLDAADKENNIILACQAKTRGDVSVDA